MLAEHIALSAAEAEPAAASGGVSVRLPLIGIRSGRTSNALLPLNIL